MVEGDLFPPASTMVMDGREHRSIKPEIQLWGHATLTHFLGSPRQSFHCYVSLPLLSPRPSAKTDTFRTCPMNSSVLFFLPVQKGVQAELAALRLCSVPRPFRPSTTRLALQPLRNKQKEALVSFVFFIAQKAGFAPSSTMWKFQPPQDFTPSRTKGIAPLRLPGSGLPG